MRKKAKAAVVWSGVDIFLRQCLSFIVSIILARLLAPEDFGTIALLSLFLGVSEIFVNAGFSAALIQNQDTTHVDESTVFWFNNGAGLVVTCILFALSPLIADFFALPVLKPLTMLMACNIMISATGSIHGILLTKRLDFKTLMKIGAISTVVSGSVGVCMAWLGYGVWALAGQALTSTGVGTALLWFFSPWRPAFTFSKDSFKRLFGFSGYVFASSLLDTIYQRGYTLLLGKFYGTRELGFFNRADSAQQIPTGIITGILSRVTLPLFSSISRDKKRLRRGVRLSIRSIMLLTAPVMAGLAVLARPFISAVFGEQWLPAAPILQVLCGFGLLFPLHVINLNVLQAQGYGNLFFRLEVIKKIVGVVLLLLGSIYGVMGIAWSRVIQSILALLINSYYTEKHLGYGIREQMMDCMPSMILSIMMAFVVAIADAILEIEGIVKLFVLIGSGAVFYLASNVVLGIGAYKEMVCFVKGEAKV